MGRPLPINILQSTRQVICQILKVHNEETAGRSQARSWLEFDDKYFSGVTPPTSNRRSEGF